MRFETCFVLYDITHSIVFSRPGGVCLKPERASVRAVIGDPRSELLWYNKGLAPDVSRNNYPDDFPEFRDVRIIIIFFVRGGFKRKSRTMKFTTKKT
jgi:hypothetical protein